VTATRGHGGTAAASRSAARDAAEAICRELIEPIEEWYPAWFEGEHRQVVKASWASGSAGFAVLFAHLYRAGRAPEWGQATRWYAEATIKALEQLVLTAGMARGFCGMVWAVEHAARVAGLKLPEDLFDEIDASLLAHLEVLPAWVSNDLLAGLAGYGAYALARLGRPLGRQCAEAVIAALEARAIFGADGCTWFSAPEQLSEDERRLSPAGRFDLGMAHGNAGIISFLACAYHAGIERRATGELLEKAIDWLVRQALPPLAASRYPGLIVSGRESTPSRLAWCYGDLGISVALLNAARRTGMDAWRREALDTGLKASLRRQEGAGVSGSGLCHGSAGVAYLFLLLAQASGEARLTRASNIWLEVTLAQRQRNGGLGGFVDPEIAPRGNLAWPLKPGFLCGAAGIALTLLTVSGRIDTGWDRFLLVAPSGSGACDDTP